MNEVERLILENQRMLLWENWRKYFVKGIGNCIEMEEYENQVKKINKLLNQTKQPSIAERTHDALSKEESE